MNTTAAIQPRTSQKGQPRHLAVTPFGQTVLVLQGGGALGAYQIGVYQAMHEAGIDPDWVVVTSIGAINGAIIAGNPPAQRIARLRDFGSRVELNKTNPLGALVNLLGSSMNNLNTIMNGVPGFFAPNPSAFLGPHANVGIERASYYATDFFA
jgi:NTE family protein